MSSHILLPVCVALIGFWMLGAYNRLVRLRNIIGSVFQTFALQARERTELVTHLIGLAREHMPERTDLVDAAVAAEQELARALEVARLKPVHPRMLAEFGRSDHALSLSLGILCSSLREHVGYADTHIDPDAQHPVLTLLGQLDGVLEQTDFARLTYNQAVSDYNTSIRLFPTTLVAAVFGFEAAALLPTVPRSTG
jgi:LemA protein